MKKRKTFTVLLTALFLCAILTCCDDEPPEESDTRISADKGSSDDSSAPPAVSSAGNETSEHDTADTGEIPGTTEPGSTTETEKQTETETEPAPVHKHSYTAAKTVDPTCTKKGYTVYKCSDCGYSYNQYIAAAGHSFGKWIVTKEATCETTGTRTHTCSECGVSEKQKLKKVDHKYADATCSKPRICVWCKEIDEATPLFGEPLYHKWDEGRWLTFNSATGEGLIHYTCSICGGTKDVIIDKNLPSYMTDNTVMRSIAYLGYDVSGQIAAGNLFSVYGSFELSKKYRSQVFYDEKAGSGLEGLDMISSSSPTGKLPDLNAFKKKGLVCASFTTYYLFNYLPNVENIDTSKLQKAFVQYINVGYHYRAVLTWKNAFDNLAASGLAEKIGTSAANVDRSKLAPGDIVIFSSEKYANSHIAIYAGYFRGEDYVVHCTWKRGVEINTLSAIADPYGDPELPGSKASAFYHIDYDKLKK